MYYLDCNGMCQRDMSSVVGKRDRWPA